MDKHTKGPWEVDQRFAGRVFQTADPNKGICSTSNYTTNRRDLTEENAANARLIAAAPDLLAACKAALGNDDWPGGPMSNEVVDKLRAAIALARGAAEVMSPTPQEERT